MCVLGGKRREQNFLRAGGLSKDGGAWVRQWGEGGGGATYSVVIVNGKTG
jgi:hypothetical protein